MYGYQIRKILLADRVTAKYFRGIYGSNNIGLSDNVVDLNTKNIIVCNISPTHHKTGIHWVLVYKSGEKNVFADSFARPIDTYPEEIGRYLKSDNFEFVPFKLQHDMSQACSIFVIYIAHYLAQGQTLSKIMQRFSSDTKFNEKMVTGWYSENFSKILPICSTDVTPAERLRCLSLGDYFTRLSKNKV